MTASTASAAVPEPPTIASLFRIAATFPSAVTPIIGGDIGRWILTNGPSFDHEAQFFDELCGRLLGAGVPLWRATLHFGTLHPQIQGFAVRWWRDRQVIEEIQIGHGADQTGEYLRSPIRDPIERGVSFRRRLDDDLSDYPLLGEIRRDGGSDYIALPLNRTYQRFPVVTWTTDRPGGFEDDHIAALHEITPALAAIVETRAVRRISANLLDTYLGAQAGRRVLAGQIRRNQGENLRAVIMSTDMRGFTALSDRLSGEHMIDMLDDYFEAIASPIHDRNGEVLKFIGDGVLAIFPTNDGDFVPAALRGLEAASAGLAHLAAINEGRRETARPEIRIGIGLHLGEVTFGNVGSADRLDFTVIGPAVNMAARLEGLTKRLMRPLLMSHDFATACPRPLVSLGFHPVRGFSEPEEVFGLPE